MTGKSDSETLLEDRDFLKYLTAIKTSGFSHHNPSISKELLIRLFQNDSSLDFDSFNEIILKTGYRSPNDLKNFKYTLVGICYVFCNRTAPYQLDFELVYHIADYLIMRIDKAASAGELKELGLTMIHTFKKMHQLYAQKKYSYQINRCIQYIYQNLYTSITLSEASRRMNLTPQYLSALFKRETGQNFSAFIQEKKIEEAKMLLEFSYLSISELSEALGFNSVSHFSNSFKAATGMAPSHYKREKCFS